MSLTYSVIFRDKTVNNSSLLSYLFRNRTGVIIVTLVLQCCRFWYVLKMFVGFIELYFKGEYKYAFYNQRSFAIYLQTIRLFITHSLSLFLFISEYYHPCVSTLAID